MRNINSIAALRLSCLLTLVFTCTIASGRDKSDIVELVNGDQLSGEIKKLEYGKLKFNTDSMGSVSIEWDDIVYLESVYAFEIETTSGDRYFGTIERAEDPLRIGIGIAEQVAEFNNTQVIRIEPIEDEFWDRVTGSLSVGLNYTKASDVGQFSLSATTSYRKQDSAITLDASSIVTRDSSNDITQRQNLSLQRQQFRGNRWFTTLNASLESNDELGLDARTSLGVGGGRFLTQTNISEFTAFGGVQGTRESLQNNADSETNVEGILGASYRRYIYDDPSVNISTSVEIFPSLTDWGRTRAEIDAQIRYELVNDLFLDLSIYNSYDSNPPSGVEATNDYGVVTSLGWSF